MTRQLMSHPNPPQIVFPKRVGSPELKNVISQRISEVLNIFTPEIDYSNDTITVQLRRSGAGRTQGFIQQKLHETGRKLGSRGQVLTLLSETRHDENTLIDINLQTGTHSPQDNEAEWTIILIHEMIHYIQGKVGAYYSTSEQTRTFQKILHHYNLNNMTTLNYRAYEACFNAYTAEGCTFTTGYGETSRKATTTAGYYTMRHEKQAHRLSYIILKELYNMKPKDAYSLNYMMTFKYEGFQTAINTVMARYN